MSLPEFSYLDELNEVQRLAVTTLEGPVMVIAGPGSGKTRVLTYRIAHLIKTGVYPGHILALTFTNKAAKEMKNRIEGVVGPQAKRVWAGTFHSLFAKILRVEAHRIGFPNDFTIYDTDDTKSLITEIINQLNLDKKVYSPGAVRSRISAAKSNLITPKLYAANEELMGLDRMNRRPLIYQIYEKYVARCLRAGAMDFDDLLLQMFRLLYQNPDRTREKYQNQFKYVMVDEFQDTNYLQYEILKLLAVYPESPNNICIVGDDAQSIYSFRGATIENILQFESDFPTLKTFKLEQNYRSTHFIVEAANEVITYNKKQIQKKIWTDRPAGNKIKVIKAASETEEGKRIADNIIEQKNRHTLKNKDIAILYRTNSQSRIFEEQMRRYNIPYRVYGGLSFYSRKEIKDIIAYIRITTNDKDDEALKRVINYPKRGIGDSTVDSIGQLAEDNDMSMWEVLNKIDFSQRTKKGMVEFVQLIRAFKAKAESSDAFVTAQYIAKHSGIVEHLKADKSVEGLSRIENIDSLLDGIKDFVENDVLEINEEISRDKTLSSYLQTISLMTDADESDEAMDSVSMMSIHAAKGLEFKSVFVTGLEENLFPSYQSLSDPNLIDEERRLFYVAITRAEEILTLSFANARYQHGDMRFNDPSRFIEEISENNLDSVVTIQNVNKGFGEPKILGAFKTKPLMSGVPKIDVDGFKASEPGQIKAGQKVLHLKFGEGKVINVDERLVASILFPQVDPNNEKRIMLNFAKLQILED
ncbi:MAG: UvrD-helicase domain-containing protein [Saprospiraceae bacterium]|nr:UvrD-helicase domain-containing protein [Saprospiraceae bacterium]MBK6564727.1 UvrD-helicase domain-containing protein [Saprospiraceae bacterium]MBK6784745.1 UvrD-helicase domain-containing protein [Saprospiraceae bacterium]MBK7523370.1 UvrD-helicase domain-containing protein [Saprospiraceae bacterium]MBK8079467.1 UvrD-helicase domain-containing protein [Saprospiraceae bacterium]